MLAAKSRWLIPALLVATAAILLAMGRSAICPCGRIALWHGAVQSDQNSQQIADWYSLSHVVHGLLFYGATWLALHRWPWTARLVVAVVVEAGWEILENSPLIIDRYRAVTMAWGYSGDSVLNSISDIAAMMLGFTIARRLPWWASAGLVVLLEVVALVAIRDNLTLNLIMLIAPVEAIRIWQAG
ncbi:DUF2585 family protein [Sphingomonas sp. RP10(2022)]|uniref:UPF0314 protein M9979_14155 n=1 Tax=Sphingomonas liriopis TaxID=2949094 RepID=A0A9X2HRT0_9SPHN|nr:DUF2585 family protein [Sphingomonas liriopis]MCP3736013.1 DUF2585 family protein [Sphingomonas liriopis]